jgi:RND family efflux transporter MFP subunit
VRKSRGTLTEIHFKDGQIVHKGDLLFLIDPRPYEIKLAKATAQLQTASARFALASVQFVRAQTLLRTSFGTAETVDQRTSEQSSAQAAIDDAKAQMRDAQLDIEYCRITAPFPGRIGGASGLIRQLDRGQPRRHQPDHPADDTRLARSYLSRFRHERIRLSNLFP